MTPVANTPMSGRGWRRAARACAVVTALGIGYFVAGSPLQLSEALRNMMAVQRAGLSELLVSQFTQGGFLRPLLLAQIDVPFELAQGRYFEVFKAIHVAQVVLAAVLFVNLLPVRGAVSALAVPFGLALFFGSHTFAGTVSEGFPINTFLTIVLCCLAAANLVQGAPARWKDAAAVTLFVYAALTVETGLLVWVCFVAAWLAGFRGVSGKALALTTGALAGYMALRFGPLHVGAPALVERSSGYGFRVLDPPELIALFGNNPLAFYAYNAAAQVLTVLFAEPRAGVWVLVHGLVTGEWLPRDLLAVTATTGATALIAWHAGTRVPAWRRGEVEDGDRWLFVAVAMLAANAVISYPYTKNVIMSPAGTFHALAASIAFGSALSRLGAPLQLRPAVAVGVVLLTVLSSVSTVRLVGLHYRLRQKAFLTRNDWMFVAPAEHVDVTRYPAAGALIRQLRDQAVTMRVPNPAFDPPLASRLFEEAW
jgi:hypothetical protein